MIRFTVNGGSSTVGITVNLYIFTHAQLIPIFDRFLSQVMAP